MAQVQREIAPCVKIARHGGTVPGSMERCGHHLPKQVRIKGGYNNYPKILKPILKQACL